MNLIFEKYYVPQLICTQKPASDSLHDQNIKLSQKITSNIQIKNNKVETVLSYFTENNDYIDVQVTIVGKYTLTFKNSETLDTNNKKMIEAIKATSISILFPYLRQTITSLTELNGNLKPVIIPMYNIAKLLNDSD